jgi:hypothetical protein
MRDGLTQVIPGDFCVAPMYSSRHKTFIIDLRRKAPIFPRRPALTHDFSKRRAQALPGFR